MDILFYVIGDDGLWILSDVWNFLRDCILCPKRAVFVRTRLQNIKERTRKTINKIYTSFVASGEYNIHSLVIFLGYRLLTRGPQTDNLGKLHGCVLVVLHVLLKVLQVCNDVSLSPIVGE